MVDISSRFGSLGKGPGFIRTFESNVSDPVVGSREELNSPTTGSPFTIQVLLPDILQESFTGGGVSIPRGIFDPLLEELNQEAILTGQEELGTRAPANVNIGIVDAALRSSNSFGKVITRQEKFRNSSFVSTNEGLRNLSEIVYGNGLRQDPTGVGLSTANQTALTDLNQALSVILQANDILRAPLLQMLINPNNLVLTYNKKQDYSSRTRYNYLVQAWGEEQVRISVNGRIGSFTASSPDGGANGETFSVSGTQWNSRKDSAAFQNLMNLFILFQNNAHIYDVLGGSEAHLWTGNIRITYDQKVYLGNFDNFNYGYEETQQNGGLIYSFNFVASQEFDNQRPGPILPIGGPGFQSALSPDTSTIQGVERESNVNEAILNPLIG